MAPGHQMVTPRAITKGAQQEEEMRRGWGGEGQEGRTGGRGVGKGGGRELHLAYP